MCCCIILLSKQCTMARAQQKHRHENANENQAAEHNAREGSGALHWSSSSSTSSAGRVRTREPRQVVAPLGAVAAAEPGRRDAPRPRDAHVARRIARHVGRAPVVDGRHTVGRTIAHAGTSNGPHVPIGNANHAHASNRPRRLDSQKHFSQPVLCSYTCRTLTAFWRRRRVSARRA